MPFLIPKNSWFHTIKKSCFKYASNKMQVLSTKMLDKTINYYIMLLELKKKIYLLRVSYEL